MVLGQSHQWQWSSMAYLVWPQEECWLQELTVTLSVPLDLRRRRPPSAGAGQVERFAFNGHRTGRIDSRSWGLEQDCETNALGVDCLPRASLLDHAVEVPVVSVVGGVDDLEIILSSGWKPLNSENKNIFNYLKQWMTRIKYFQCHWNGTCSRWEIIVKLNFNYLHLTMQLRKIND